MKRKIFLAIYLCSFVAILLIGTALVPIPADPGTGGCDGPTFCQTSWDGDEWVFYNNKGLQEPPWFQCCGQICPSEDQGRVYQAEDPIEGE